MKMSLNEVVDLEYPSADDMTPEQIIIISKQRKSFIKGVMWKTKKDQETLEAINFSKWCREVEDNQILKRRYGHLSYAEAYPIWEAGYKN